MLHPGSSSEAIRQAARGSRILDHVLLVLVEPAKATKQKVSDGNDEKAVVAALSFRPENHPNMNFGVAVHADDIPGDPSGAPVLQQGTEELVATAFFETPAGPLEILAEVAAMTNETQADAPYGWARCEYRAQPTPSGEARAWDQPLRGEPCCWPRSARSLAGLYAGAAGAAPGSQRRAHRLPRPFLWRGHVPVPG